MSLKSILRRKEQPQVSNKAKLTGSLAQWDDEDSRTVVLVTLLQCELAAVRKSLNFHQKRASYKAVYVVTEPNISDIRIAGCVPEYFPSIDTVHNFPTTGDWFSYLRERWNIVNSKWRPSWIVVEGISIDQYLESVKKQVRV